MNTEQFAAALQRRMKDQILGIDEKPDTYVLHLRNSRTLSVDFEDLKDDPESIMLAVEERLALPLAVK